MGGQSARRWGLQRLAAELAPMTAPRRGRGARSQLASSASFSASLDPIGDPLDLLHVSLFELAFGDKGALAVPVLLE
jgi:hypothetical protein